MLPTIPKQTMKKISGFVALLVVVGLPTSAKAESNFADITGTNFWNNVAPGFYDDYKLDPELVARINRINSEGEAAYQSCNAAIAQLEQAVPETRRFARRPAPPPAVPVACQQLESLRAEAASLRTTLEEIARARPRPETRTW
jgi:hypothetical protein